MFCTIRSFPNDFPLALTMIGAFIAKSGKVGLCGVVRARANVSFLSRKEMSLHTLLVINDATHHVSLSNAKTAGHILQLLATNHIFREPSLCPQPTLR